MHFHKPTTVHMSPGDLPWLWQGVETWTVTDMRWQPWRVDPAAGAGRLGRLMEKARMPAGVRSIIDTDADAVALTVWAADERVRPLDAVVDGRLLTRREMTAGEQAVHIDLPAGRHRVEVWLPQFGEIAISPMAVQNATFVNPPAPPTRLVSVYGSSITQGRQADGPSEIWPALLARRKGWGLRCWGMAGNCHLDPVMATTIAAHPADLIVMCIGANIHAEASFSARTLAPQLIGFLDTVRAGHPNTPIVVMSTIGSPAREDRSNAAGLSMSNVREIVEQAVQGLIDAAEPALHRVNGLDVLALSEHDKLIDEVHPGPQGHRVIAQRVAEHLDALGLG